MITRRRALRAASVPLVAGAAGCLGDAAPRDTDGDGVVDSRDYAPRDPTVQELSDVGIGVVGDADDGPSGDPPWADEDGSATAEPRTASGQLRVDASALTGFSHVVHYGPDEVRVHVERDDLDDPDRRMKLVVVAMGYPRGERYAVGQSAPFAPGGDREVTVAVDRQALPDDEPFHYVAFAAPPDRAAEEVGGDGDGDGVEFLHETDRVRFEDGRLVRDPHPEQMASVALEEYTRRNVEGMYVMTFSGRTEGRDWTAGYAMYKSTYVRAVERPRGRSRAEYVKVAASEGPAEQFGALLRDQAERNGFTSERSRVAFAIDLVQTLPYVTDDVSKGFDDYTKFIEETLVEASGDCEDTAVLLAAILQSPAFDRDTVLLKPPGHMAIGVASDPDTPGVYGTHRGTRYYYVETTGNGWGIGDVPDVHRGEGFKVYPV